MEISIKIPDGDYCNGCKFLNYYHHPLINIMGDPTGNFREGYECKNYECDLSVEKTDCCCEEKVKKCYWCSLTEEQRQAIATLGVMLLLGYPDNPMTKDGK